MKRYDMELNLLEKDLKEESHIESWYKKHKDDAPLKTVEKIRNILIDLGIFTFERFWFNPIKNVYSVRVMTSEFGNVGTNGKGITQAYALASAYAEFMERLQTFSLIKKHFGLMKEVQIKYPDVELIDKCKISKPIIDILSGNNEFSELLEDKLVCFPYYNLQSKSISYIPEKVMLYTSSNGYCAGNTPQEAICQGICEILERYSAIAIYNKKLSVPTIPLETIQHLDVYKFIIDIKNRGYNVLVKDCTLDGLLPVLSVVIFSRDYSKCIVNFGSDLSFEVALMRCITESYQGINSLSDENRFMTLNNSVLKTNPLPKRRSKEDFYIYKIIDQLLLSETEPNYENAFIDHFINSQKSLDFITSKLIGCGYDIYVRDVSFLGFPTYSVYIPGMSECYTYDEVLAYYKLYVKTPPVLLQLPNAEKEWVEMYIQAMEDILKTGHFTLAYGDNDLDKFIKDSTKGLVLDFRSDLYILNLQYLLSLLYYKIGKYEQAMYYLDVYLNNLSENEKYLYNIAYFRCAVYYFKFLSQNKPSDVILESLRGMFGEELSNEILQDLENPDDVFQYLKLPTCGNCSTCSVCHECKYEEWKDVILKLQDKIDRNLPDQLTLSSYFCTFE